MPSKTSSNPLFNEGHVLLARKYSYGLAFLMFMWANWGSTLHSIRLVGNLAIMGYIGSENVPPQKVSWDVIAYLGETISYALLFFGGAFLIRWLLNELSNAICETERQVQRKTRERRRHLRFLVSEEQLMARINTLELCLGTSIKTARSLEEQIVKLSFNIEALENRKRPKRQTLMASSNEPVDLFTPKPTKPTLVKQPKRRAQIFPKFELPKF